MLVSILLFFFLTYVTGLALVQLATGRYRLNFETHVMCTGAGLAAFALITAVFGLFRMPLTWIHFGLTAVVLFVLGSLRDILSKKVSDLAKAREDFWPKDSWYLVAAVAMAAVLLAVFLHGAFVATPWLIDDDSWHHAEAAKHIARTLSYKVDVSVRERMTGGYLEPYPVAYPVLMAMLHQVQQFGQAREALPKGSIVWTLKFFNALIVCLGLVYFFILMKRWTRRPAAALWMTGVLWVLPCFMSHFIWAQSMALALFFPAFWAMERARGEARWNLVAALVTAGILLTQPSCAAAFVLMAAIYWGVNLWRARQPGEGDFSVRETMLQGGAMVLGALLSLVYYVPELNKFGWSEFVRGITRTPVEKLGLDMSGAGRWVYYGITDFIWAPASTNINQPTGVGVALFLLFAAALVWAFVRWSETRSDRMRLVALAWLVLATLGILGNYFPARLFPHRFWAFFAIPVAMLTGDALARATAAAKPRTVIAALAGGSLIGGAVALWGVGELMNGLDFVPLSGARLFSALGFTLAGLAVVLVALYALMLRSQTAREWQVFIVLGAAAAGVALTSGYPKARFEGFSQWYAGYEFYRGALKLPGSDQLRLEQTELYAYLGLSRALPRNMPVFGLTCTDRRILGFDLYTPPMDEDLNALREYVRSQPIEALDNNLAGRIHQVVAARKFPYLTVDYYWAAVPQWRQARAAARARRIMAEARMTSERLREITSGGMAPTPLEEKTLRDLDEPVQEEHKNSLLVDDALARTARLNEVLQKSGLFDKWGVSIEFGLTLYKVKPLTEPEK